MAVILILCGASIAQAGLMDLTPGGYIGFPPPVVTFFEGFSLNGLQFIASAADQNGQPVWDPFTMFGADNFSVQFDQSTNSAVVGWNITGTGFRLTYILMEPVGGLGTTKSNLYRVGGGTPVEGSGSVTIDGVTQIENVDFAGTNHPLPEGGWTLGMFAAALIILLGFAVRAGRVMQRT